MIWMRIKSKSKKSIQTAFLHSLTVLHSKAKTIYSHPRVKAQEASLSRIPRAQQEAQGTQLIKRPRVWPSIRVSSTAPMLLLLRGSWARPRLRTTRYRCPLNISSIMWLPRQASIGLRLSQISWIQPIRYKWSTSSSRRANSLVWVVALEALIVYSSSRTTQAWCLRLRSTNTKCNTTDNYTTLSSKAKIKDTRCQVSSFTQSLITHRRSLMNS